MDRKQFLQLLEENQGVVVVKYSATWCGPCKKVQPLLNQLVPMLPPSVTYLELDVDDDFDLYAHFKAKKQVVGVPVLLAFKKGNVTPYADHSVSGTNEAQIVAFFKTVAVL